MANPTQLPSQRSNRKESDSLHTGIERQPVYLAYLDDSGTRDRGKTYQVLASVIVEDKEFSDLEALLGYAVDAVLPTDRIEKFEEFHAYELWGGYGLFDGVDQGTRFNVIRTLLEYTAERRLPIVYGAVNKVALGKQLYASADPVDICFRICANGIDNWMAQLAQPQLAILIVDECAKDIRHTLRKSFRQMRRKNRPPDFAIGLEHIHDDMYFGESKESIGLQLADLCGYFIAKHLEGDAAVSGFYDIIRDRIVYSKTEPQ